VSRKEAERIDLENKKILAAILRVKPSGPVRKDRNHIERQQQLLSSISKSQK
jgi:hypothetical protein